MRLPSLRLHAITDRSLLPGAHTRGQLLPAERDGLVRLARGWAAAGVEAVQLREKDLPRAALAELLAALAGALAGSGTRLLLNAGSVASHHHAVQLAQAAGAAGVHLPGGWTAAAVAAVHREGLCVSVACHAVEQAVAARQAGADAVLLSPIFATLSHPEAPALGLAALATACRAAAPVPVFALGGVDAASAPLCSSAGAAGVAGIRWFLTPATPEEG